jgi:hypothetical protein
MMPKWLLITESEFNEKLKQINDSAEKETQRDVIVQAMFTWWKVKGKAKLLHIEFDSGAEEYREVQ